MKLSLQTKSALLSFVILTCCAMSTGDDQVSGPMAPSYTSLEEEAGYFNGIIIDGSATANVEGISFGGETILKEVRRESDDSSNNLNLAKIKKVEITKPNFSSTRYSEKEFSLVTITTTTDEVIKDMLIPRKIVVCAIDGKSRMEKAWFIYKINSITISHVPATDKPFETMPVEQPASPEGKTLLQKAAQVGRSAANVAIEAGKAVVSAVKKTGEYISESVK